MLPYTLLAALAFIQADSSPPLVGASDYPPEALARKEQGSVQALLTMGPSGRAIECIVVISSNSEALDSKTCEILLTRGGFTTPLDKDGKPEVDELTTPPIEWVLPGSAASQSGSVKTAVQEPPSPGTASKTIICDAEPGMLHLHPAPAAFKDEIGGVVEVVDVAPSPKWLPFAGFNFSVAGQQSTPGVHVVVDPRFPDELIVVLRRPLERGYHLVTRVPKGTAVPIKARLQGNVMVVTALGNVQATKLPIKVGRPEMACSSGRFQFRL
jgi:TonB family protein